MNRDVKKFFRKAWILLVFILVPMIIELLLPVDFFNFRFFEALSFKGVSQKLSPGYFYSNTHLIKEETGELGHHTPYAEAPRRVECYIDAFGYRNKAVVLSPEIVLFGDSYVTSPGLNQDHIITEEVSRRLNVPVYGMGPANINNCLDKLPKLQKPKLVIFLQAERNLAFIDAMGSSIGQQKARKFFADGLPLKSLILADRLITQKMIRYSRARINNEVFPTQYIAKDSTLFMDGKAMQARIMKTEVLQVVDRLASYQEYFASQGIDFLFMAIPEKETVMYDLIEGAGEIKFLDNLYAALDKKGIPYIRLKDGFMQVYHQQQQKPYFKDDTHWNELGVGIAADSLAQYYRNHQKAAQ